MKQTQVEQLVLLNYNKQEYREQLHFTDIKIKAQQLVNVFISIIIFTCIIQRSDRLTGKASVL